MQAPYIALQIIRQGGVDHIHAHFAVSQTEIAMALAVLLDRRYSFTGHARDLYATPNALQEKIRQALFVVTCTQYNADYELRKNPVASNKVVLR